MDNKYKRMNSSERVRIVPPSSGSLPRQGFEPLREEDPDREVSGLNLIPYSLVTLQRSGARRPVLFSPAALAGPLLQRLLPPGGGGPELSGCRPDVLTKEEFQLRQSVEPFVHYKEKTATFEVISREKIEDVAAKGRHCLLEAELSCVKDLLRREIYPIIIFIKICERNVKRLRKLPLRLESEEDFVRACRIREKELEGVACLYSTVEPDAWAGPDDLVRVVKERIQEEQRKVVWVEQDLL
uniref:Guanylate kinase-like domain-containing protein n=2 Tax=Gadus morhua TaxID=8049 RepID=A0A8C5FBD1_GADMO